MNEYWHPNAGGWFIWMDGDEFKAVLPDPNLLVLNDCNENHLVNTVAHDVPEYRYTIQIWGDLNKPIVIKNVLSESERLSLWDYFDRRSPSMNSLATWTYNNASYGQGDPVSWQHPLRTDLIFTKCATVRLKMMHLRRDIKLCKIHANGQTAGQNTLFHKDWEEHGVWTFIYFNQPYWDVEWGGEFVCQTPDDEYHFTPYVLTVVCLSHQLVTQRSTS